VTVRYRNSRNSTVNYLFDFTRHQDGDNVTYSYVGPRDTSAQAFVNTMTSVADLLKMLEGQFNVTAYTSRFDLTNTKLSSTSDPDLWFVVTLSN
jgi:hypothetical protein